MGEIEGRDRGEIQRDRGERHRYRDIEGRDRDREIERDRETKGQN